MDRTNENTPQAALTKACNDAIARGEPIITEIPAAPHYQQCFSDFDHDYCALILELGDNWEDSTWRNDSMPSAYGRKEFLGVRIWFDYADAALSEFTEYRLKGEMKKFAIALADGGDEFVFSSDDWAETKAFVIGGGLAAYISANPELIQEARDYCSESPVHGVTKYAEPKHSGIQEIIEFAEMDPKNATTPVAVYRDGEDYFWGYYMDNGMINAIEGNVESTFATVEAFKEYAIQAINDERPIVIIDEPAKIPTAEELKPIIAAACGENDLDAAALKIQDALGVETGDVAGQFFSDLNDGDWEKMSVSERAEKMEEYVRIELLYLTPDEDEEG